MSILNHSHAAHGSNNQVENRHLWLNLLNIYQKTLKPALNNPLEGFNGSLIPTNGCPAIP